MLELTATHLSVTVALKATVPAYSSYTYCHQWRGFCMEHAPTCGGMDLITPQLDCAGSSTRFFQDGSALRSLLIRRDKLIDYIEALIVERGEEVVIFGWDDSPSTETH